MSEERCNVCNRELSSLGEDGCEDCGLDYDPLAPAEGKPLSFEDRPRTYEDKYGELPLTPEWDAEDE